MALVAEEGMGSETARAEEATATVKDGGGTPLASVAAAATTGVARCDHGAAVVADVTTATVTQGKQSVISAGRGRGKGLLLPAWMTAGGTGAADVTAVQEPVRTSAASAAADSFLGSLVSSQAQEQQHHVTQAAQTTLLPAPTASAGYSGGSEQGGGMATMASGKSSDPGARKHPRPQNKTQK